MSTLGTHHSPPHSYPWLRNRLKRHLSELSRLALPAIMMRIGLMALAMVDTAMVGHYATQHLAWLNLANQSVIMFALVVGLGLLSGIMVYSANAFGMDDFREAGRVWRRSLPFTLVVGAVILLVILPAEYWLTLLGQTPENAETSGWIAVILALGLPGHMLFVNCTMFLEGVKRAEVGFYMMLAANLVNVALNYALIFGHFGMPELGAEGSAWASTGVRWFMAASALLYVWYAPSLKKFEVRRPHGQAYRDWTDQRQMGYASAVSLAAEVLAFSALAIFAGWIGGEVPLAAHGVIFQVVGIPLMISIGIGVASMVRVGISFARKDRADTALAGIAGILMNFMVVGILGIGIYFYVEEMIMIFTSDTRIIELLLPITSIFILAMLLDASQMVASMIIRGFKETWWPTYLQAFSFAFVMLPVCYLLAFPAGMGLKGLMLGMLIGVSVAWTLQVARFIWLVRRPLAD